MRTTHNLARSRLPRRPAAKGYSSPSGLLLRTRGWADTAGGVGTVALGERRTSAPTQAQDIAPLRADWTGARPSRSPSWGGGAVRAVPDLCSWIHDLPQLSVAVSWPQFSAFFAPDYTLISLSALPFLSLIPFPGFPSSYKSHGSRHFSMKTS